MFRFRFSILTVICLFLSGLSTSKTFAQAKEYPTHTMVSYLGWLPSSFNSQGIGHPTDFPVMSLLDRDGNVVSPENRNLIGVGQELKILSDHGWDCMLADFLFFTESHIKRHIGLTRRMLNAADLFELPEHFKIAPFIRLPVLPVTLISRY